MAVKYNISWNYPFSKVKYRSEVKEFTDENHFRNFLNYCSKDESRRKIIGTERIYEETKSFSANDMKAAFEAGKKGLESFEQFCRNYLKKEIS